jgi:3-oxoacyl-[acyl-carrier protein] reductase
MKACEGKVALVTGAAGSGLGRSIALTLAREGAKVIVNYRTSEAQALAIVEQIESSGGCATAVAADVFTSAGCAALVDSALAQFGQLDICVIGPGGGWHPQQIDQLAPEAVLEDLHSETAPLLYLMSRVLPNMYKRRWGRIIGLASHPIKRSPAYAYNVAKAARLEALLLAEDQAWEYGVTVNVIAPGPVDGLPDLADAVDQAHHGKTWQNRANVSPQDIAEGVAFLCSEAGQFISGCVLPYLFH